jgi:hypothetical protein
MPSPLWYELHEYFDFPSVLPSFGADVDVFDETIRATFSCKICSASYSYHHVSIPSVHRGVDVFDWSQLSTTELSYWQQIGTWLISVARTCDAPIRHTANDGNAQQPEPSSITRLPCLYHNHILLLFEEIVVTSN